MPETGIGHSGGHTDLELGVVMPGEFHFTSTPIVIGLPWSKAIALPENLTGKVVRLILRKQFEDAEVATFISPTNITIGTPGATTTITVTLTADDTAGLTDQVVSYVLEVVNGRRYLFGTIPVQQ